MLDEQLRANGPPDTFDNTMIGNYAGCERKLYWFLRGVDYQNTPPYFITGRALGAGLNAFYELDGSIKERTIIAIHTAEALWDEEAPEEGRNDTRENLRRLLKEYAYCYPREPWEQKSKHGELGFAFPIPGTEIYYAGAVDAYIEWSGYGVLIREDKSKGGYLDTNYQKHWDRASQVTGYLWAIQQLIGEVPFGALMNLISKVKQKQTENQFARNLVTKSEFQLQEFMAETVYMADKIRRQWDHWTWAKSGERMYLECTGGAGKSPCLYGNLCKMEVSPRDISDSMVSDEEFAFRDGPWAPWEREGDT